MSSSNNLTTLLQWTGWASVSMFFILIIDEVTQPGWLLGKTHRGKSCIVFLFLARHPSGQIKGVQPGICSKVSAWNVSQLSVLQSSLRSAAIVLTALRESSSEPSPLYIGAFSGSQTGLTTVKLKVFPHGNYNLEIKPHSVSSGDIFQINIEII